MKNTIIAIVSLLILLVVCFYGYEFVFKKPLVESPTETPLDYTVQTKDVKMQLKDGLYTYVGEVSLPTPCHTFEASISADDSGKDSIVITTSSLKDGVMCAQVLTQRTFKVSTPVALEEDAVLTVYLDGDATNFNLNIFEIPEDANIDTYQLQIKG